MARRTALRSAPQSSTCVTLVSRSACQFTRACRGPLSAATERSNSAPGRAADKAQARGACDRPQTWGTMRWKARACRLLCYSLGLRAACFLLRADALSVVRRLRLRVLGRRARGGGCGHRKPVLQRQRRAARALPAAPSCRRVGSAPEGLVHLVLQRNYQRSRARHLARFIAPITSVACTASGGSLASLGLTRAGIAGLLESDDPKDALDGFASVIQMEKEKGEWCVSFAPPSLRARLPSCCSMCPKLAPPDCVTACRRRRCSWAGI